MIFSTMEQTGEKLIKRYRTARNCSACGKICYKQSHDMKVWSGLCMSCAATKRMSVRTGEKHHNWVPFRKCIDCGGNIPKKSHAGTKRCNACFRKFTVKENHPHWQGGKTEENHLIRNSNEYKAWSKAVKVRDNYTCQICSKRGCELHSDHVKPFSLYPELRFEISNGRTLCKRCHELHGWRLFKDQNPRKNWVNVPGKNSCEVQVICMDNHKVYVSVARAAKSLNISRQHISSVINGNRPRVGGYVFQRLTDEHLIF